MKYILLYASIVLPQVQDVTVTSGVLDGSPSLTVSWSAVSDESGINYTVWYSTSNGTETEPPSGASIVSGITGTSTTLSGLEEDTEYYIWVAAVSSDGQGSYSARVSHITNTGIVYTLHMNVHILEKGILQYICLNVSYLVPDAPTDLMIYLPSGSCDQLMVTWTTPSNTGGLPVNYTVYRNGVEIKSMITTESTILSDLTADTEYTVTVVTVNELGEGRNVTGTGRTRPEGLNKNHVVIYAHMYFV